MMMMLSLLTMAVLVMVPFTLAALRQMVQRAGRPAWLARRFATRGPSSSGMGAAGAQELLALMNPNKHVEREQRETDQVLRIDANSAAPPHTVVNLDTQRVVIRRTPPPTTGPSPYRQG
ncbi:DUF6191 domain-containing protein [Embleya sp. AB8]|uniref:DUF6191 domain-containing protein n=1 Tax=Embleya sp. AB8 TaxID=3156304 RepID=UPI003C707E69